MGTSRVSRESRETCSIIFGNILQSPACLGDVSASPRPARDQGDWGDVAATSPAGLGDLLETGKSQQQKRIEHVWIPRDSTATRQFSRRSRGVTTSSHHLDFRPMRKGHNILKALFNIVEEQLKKIIELWCQCCIMMFRKVNKQPGMQKFWNWCSHYQEIYDWISPLNKRAGSAFILTQ